MSCEKNQHRLTHPPQNLNPVISVRQQSADDDAYDEVNIIGDTQQTSSTSKCDVSLSSGNVNKQTGFYQPLPPSRDTTALIVAPARHQNNNNNNSKIKKSSNLLNGQHDTAEHENSQPGGECNIESHDKNRSSADLNNTKMSSMAGRVDQDNSSFMGSNRRQTLPPATGNSLLRGVNFDFLLLRARSTNNNEVRTRTNTSANNEPFLTSPINNNTTTMKETADNDDDDAQGEHVVNPPIREHYNDDEEAQPASTYRVPVVERSLFRSAFVASVAPVSGAYLEQISTNVIRSVCRKLLQVSVKPLFTGVMDSSTNHHHHHHHHHNTISNHKKKEHTPLSLQNKNGEKKTLPLPDQSPSEEATQQPKRQVSSVGNNNNNNTNNTLNAVLAGKMQIENKNQVATAVSNADTNSQKEKTLAQQHQKRMFHKFVTSASALRLNSTAERLARVLTMVPKNWILVTAAAASSMAATTATAQQLFPHSPTTINDRNNSNHANSASVLLTSVRPDTNSAVAVVKEEPVIEAKILTVATSTPNTSLATTSRLLLAQDDDLPATATCGLAGLRDLLKARSLRFLNSNDHAKKNNHNSCGSMIASVVSLPGLPLLPLVDEFAESCNEGKSNKTSPLDDDSTKHQQQQEQQQLKRPNNATTLAVDDIHLKEFVELGSPSGLNSFLCASPSVFDLTDAAMKDYLHTARYPGTFRPVATLGAGAFGTAYLVVYKEKQDVIERQTKDLEFRSSHAITEEFYLSSTVFSSPPKQQQQQEPQLQHTNSLSQQNAADLIFGSLNNKVVGQNSVVDEPIIAFESETAEKKNSDNKRNEGANKNNNSDNSDAQRFANFLSEAATPTNQRNKQQRRNASNVSFFADQREESALTTTTNVTTDAGASIGSQGPSLNDLPIQIYQCGQNSNTNIVNAIPRARYDQVSNNHNNPNCSNSGAAVNLPKWVLPPGRITLVRVNGAQARLPQLSPTTTTTSQSKHPEIRISNNDTNDVDEAIISPPRAVANKRNNATSNGNARSNSKSRSVNMIGRTSPSSPRSDSGGKNNNNNNNNNNRRERQQPVWKTRNPLTKKSIVPVGGPAGCGSGMSCTTLNVTVTMTKKTPESGATAATSTPTRQGNNTKNNNNNNTISRVLTIPRERIFVCKVEKLPDALSLKRRKLATDIKSKMPWDSDIHIDPGENDDNDDDGKNKNKNPSPSAAAEIAKKRLERMQNEAHILSNIAHPNIVGYVDYFFDKKANRQLLFLEYVDGGDLFKEIERRRKNVPKLYFSLETVLHIFVQVVLAVEYLHRHNILHRDIKSQNILLSKFLFVKLTDFGTAKQFDQDVDQNVECGIAGSPLFMCAARLNGAYYSQKSEMWSLGVLLYELLSFEYPFMSNDIKELMSMIENAEPRPLRRQGEKVPIELFRLLESLLQKNADDRPTAKQVLTQHPIIAKAVRGYETRLQRFTESSDVSTPADAAWLFVLRDHIRAVYEDHPVSMSSQQSRVQDSVARGDVSRTKSGGGVSGGSFALGGNASLVSRGESSRQQNQEKHPSRSSPSASAKFLNRNSSISNNNTINNNDTNNNNSDGHHTQTPRRAILMQVLQPLATSEGWSGSRSPSLQGNNNNNDSAKDVKKDNNQSSPVSSSIQRVVSLILARSGEDDDDDEAEDDGECNDNS